MASLTKGQTTESLEQLFHVYDDVKSDYYERKLKVCEVCSCNSHQCFSLKWLRFDASLVGGKQQYLQRIHGKVGSYMLDYLRKIDIL